MGKLYLLAKIIINQACFRLKKPKTYPWENGTVWGSLCMGGDSHFFYWNSSAIMRALKH